VPSCWFSHFIDFVFSHDVTAVPDVDPMPNDLDKSYRGQLTNAKEDCVRTMECIPIAPLVAKYLEQLIGEPGRYPLTYDCHECVSWFGLKMVLAAREDEEIEVTTLTFRMEHELTHALSLPENSELTVRMPDRTGHYYIYYDDLIETMGLRLSDRKKLIDEFSLQQLEGMEAYLETIIPILHDAERVAAFTSINSYTRKSFGPKVLR
jgi:hypothetical protein